MNYFHFRRKYPSKNPSHIDSSSICLTKDNDVNDMRALEDNKDDELMLFGDGDEAEKTKDRLLAFDSKKYELVTADGKYEDADDFDNLMSLIINYE